MHAKIAHPAFEKERTDGIGHAADADLQAVAVVDFSRDQPPHRGVDLAGWRIRQFGRRGVVALDHVVDLADVHARLFTIDIGQPAGRLDDDHPGALDDRAVPEIRRTQIEIAAFIDRACLEDDDVDRVDEAPIVIRDFTKIDRDVIAASVIVLSPVVAGIMQAERIDMMAFGIGIQHGAGAHRQTMADLDVGDFLDAGAKRFVEDIGLAQCCAVVEPHAGSDETGGTLSGNHLRLSAGDSHRHRFLGEYYIRPIRARMRELPGPGRALDRSGQDGAPNVIDCHEASWRRPAPLEFRRVR